MTGERETSKSFRGVIGDVGRTASQSVLTTAVRTRTTGSVLGNARKRRESLQRQEQKAYATILVDIVQRSLICSLAQFA